MDTDWANNTPSEESDDTSSDDLEGSNDDCTVEGNWLETLPEPHNT